MRDAIVPRFNPPAEPARIVGFGNQAASAREIPEELGSDGARVQVRTTGPGQKRDSENKNGIRKTGLVVRGKNGIQKTRLRKRD